MSNLKKALIGIPVSLLVIAGVIFLIAFSMLRKPLPQYDGEKSFKGLNSKVQVYRDSNAVPLIVAKNDEDAAFTLGYIHAQERLFQMDIARRAGQGRLSEVFGTATLPYDKMFRTVGISKNAASDFQKINSLSNKILTAYSAGVNSFINEAKGNYQTEFDVLGYDPQPWKPEHSLIIAKMMAWELNISWWTDVAFSSLIQKIGIEKAKLLLPDFPENAPTIIPSGFDQIPSINLGLLETDKNYRAFSGFIGTHIGSNNWVVNGNKSVSSKPIIANDPHLAFSAPGKWYFVMIESPTWNIEGFTIPGLPAAVIGKNKSISWVMTNVMADDADFYSEKLDTTGTKYFTDGSWKKIDSFEEVIRVKDSSDVRLKIMRTHRGPIISGIHPYNVLFPKKKNEAVLSMRWTGNDFSDEVYAAMLINKSKNWEEFKTALSHFTIPGQNFVYADIDGNIGYICAAKLPIRQTQNPTLIFDGTNSSNDWKGFVPYSEMPKLFNPAQNYIASANNKTVKSFPYHISNLWEPSSRIIRISELLNSKEKHSVSDFMKYQNDMISPYARQMVKHILNAFAYAKINDSNLKQALKLFESWDYEMNAMSQVPTIYSMYFKYLIKNTFYDELESELLQEYVLVANVPYRILPQMIERNESTFFDNINTPKIESRDDIIRNSLSDALTFLEKNYGKNISGWQWGTIHKVTFKHMFSGKSGIVDKLINIGPFEIGGDGTTVFNTEYSFRDLFAKNKKGNDRYQNILGPSMRFIYDFSNPEELYFILPTGQSGHFMSYHYSDLTDRWIDGKYIKLDINRSRFISQSKNKMVFNP